MFSRLRDGEKLKLSVIIPCLNAAETIEAQLQALATQDWAELWEVIVADNGSTDESMDIVQRYIGRIPHLRIVDASARKGQPFALNVGVQAARGESLAFADADDEVGQGWVGAMGQALSHHDFIAASWEIEKLNPSSITQSRHNPQGEGLQKIWYPPFLPHAGGGTIGVKRKLFLAVGGMDESLPYLHDTDLCFKIQIQGTSLQFVREAVMHIRFRTSLAQAYRQAKNYAQFNVLLFKRYRNYGRAVSSLGIWRGYLHSWESLIGRIPEWATESGRFRWVWGYGTLIGRLRGSLRYHSHPV